MSFSCAFKICTDSLLLAAKHFYALLALVAIHCLNDDLMLAPYSDWLWHHPITLLFTCSRVVCIAVE